MCDEASFATLTIGGSVCEQAVFVARSTPTLGSQLDGIPQIPIHRVGQIHTKKSIRCPSQERGQLFRDPSRTDAL